MNVFLRISYFAQYLLGRKAFRIRTVQKGGAHILYPVHFFLGLSRQWRKDRRLVCTFLSFWSQQNSGLWISQEDFSIPLLLILNEASSRLSLYSQVYTHTHTHTHTCACVCVFNYSTVKLDLMIRVTVYVNEWLKFWG